MTTIRILLDLIRADSGVPECSVWTLAKNSRKEMVDYFRALCGSTDSQIVKQLTDRLEIDLSRRIGEYSKGTNRNSAAS